MIRWTGLAPWEFEFPVPGSLTSTCHNRREPYDAASQNMSPASTVLDSQSLKSIGWSETTLRGNLLSNIGQLTSGNISWLAMFQSSAQRSWPLKKTYKLIIIENYKLLITTEN